MGALTLKPNQHTLREWELTTFKGYDLTDGLGVEVKFSKRGEDIILSEPYNEIFPWITDRGRLFFEGMAAISQARSANWNLSFDTIEEIVYLVDYFNFLKLKNNKFTFIFDQINLETYSMLKILQKKHHYVELKLSDKLNVNNDFENFFQLSKCFSLPLLFRSTIGFILNVDLRNEGSLLNIELRQRMLKGNFKLFSAGSILDTSFEGQFLGSSFHVLEKLGIGQNFLCREVKNSYNPVSLTSRESSKRSDFFIYYKILKYASNIKLIWNNLNFLTNNLSVAGILSIEKVFEITNKSLKDSLSLHFLNISLKENSNLNKILEYYLLNFRSFDNFTQTSRVVFEQTKYNSLEHVVLSKFYDYYHLPVRFYYEVGETFINTKGFTVKVNKVIDIDYFGKKTDWYIIRKIYFNSNQFFSISSKKDFELVSFETNRALLYRTFYNFQYIASVNLTTLSFYLKDKNSDFFSITSFVKIFKEIYVKYFDTKIKYWLDDFFNNSGRDLLSYKSYTLINSSKNRKLNSTNFF